MANPSDSSPEKTGGLWGRLFGVEQESENKDQNGDKADEQQTAPAEPAPPVAQRVEPPVEPVAPLVVEPVDPPSVAAPPVAPAETEIPNLSLEESAVPAAPAQEQAAPPALASCPACGSQLKAEAEYCGDCGYSLSHVEAAAPVVGHTPPQFPLKERYQVGALISQRLGVYRYAGQDLKDDSGQPQPVVIVTSAAVVEPAEAAVAVDAAVEEIVDNEEEFMPSFDEAVAEAVVASDDAPFPSAGWERSLLDKAGHPALPRVLDHFVEGDFEYLIEQLPQGRDLWDAWDDPEADAGTRYGYLIQITEGLRALTSAGAMIEGVRPDLIRVTAEGQAVVADLTDLLPLPVPPDVPVRGTLYTAPELMVNPDRADARATLYSLGATLYSLEYLHHGLEEKDFENPYSPMLITERYPDVHPAFNRLIIKSFVRDLNTRFPTSDQQKIDASGLTEFIETLQICKRNFERVRLDIAAWTTTGMIRTNNEDAFGLMHACESRMDDVYEYALLVLCDGMGGYESGEVAAAMSIEAVREFLLQQPMFAALAGKKREEFVEFDVEKCKEHLKNALVHANSTVYGEARRPGSNRRGMGCTADVVYVDDYHIVVGHVGDSRVYHVTNNTIRQLTRDHTLVNRLVELGMLTAEEAENHERKNELQQAIGGQPTVEPGVYSAPIKRGDWVLVCSDGLTGHIKDRELEQMLTRETSGTAEDACRRLLNLVNLRGATDNSTIVLVRAS